MGRRSTNFAGTVRSLIVKRKYRVGEFLPSIRSLGAEHRLAPETVRLGLKALQREGLLGCVPGHGFKVLGAANDPLRGCPVAYVLDVQRSDQEWAALNRAKLDCLQLAAGGKGWTILGVGAAGLEPSAIVERCLAANAWGLLVSDYSEAVIQQAARNGLSAVVMGYWDPLAQVDCVVQNDFQGGVIAARHLLDRGFDSIAWFGPVESSLHSRNRFSGAASALAEWDRSFCAVVDARLGDAELVRQAREMLSAHERPQAVLSFWRSTAQAIAAAAGELGLRLGQDLEMVGWCAEELRDVGFRSVFPSGYVPPSIGWSMRAMAEVALARLAERRARPQGCPLEIRIPTQLVKEETR